MSFSHLMRLLNDYKMALLKIVLHQAIFFCTVYANVKH